MRWLTLMSAPLLAAACSFGPMETTHPLDVEEVSGEVVSVCYTSRMSTREEIEAFAMDLCSEEGSTLRVWKANTFLNECPLLLKNRVTFICVPPDVPPEEGQ